MKVSLQGERQTLLGCRSRASTDPSVPEIRAAAAAAAHEAWPWRRCRAEKRHRGTRSLSRSHMGHICALQSLPKAQGFHEFLSTAKLCIEAWCFWMHLGFIVPLKLFSTLRSAAFFCSPED